MFIKQASVLGATLALATASPAMAKDYLVKFKDAAQFVAATSQKTLGNLPIIDTHATGQLAKISLDDTSEQALTSLGSLLASDDIEYIVENFPLRMLGVPDDPNYQQQWALEKINAPRAWQLGVGSRSVVVAVIDTGVDWNHPDLAANIWTNSGEVAGNGIDDDGNGFIDDIRGWDFLGDDANPKDETSMQNPGHGTHCAGIIGAVGNNGIGISGINHQVAIMPLRFIGPSGDGDLMAAIKAIDYAIANKADVISASWGGAVAEADAKPLIEAVERASAAGVTFVAAAANDGANNDREDMYPANADVANLIAVAASDANDRKPSWSNYGKAKVHLAAPGAGILSTLPRSKYGELSGTSMATPLVAGLVALIKSQAKESISGAQARALLQATGAAAAIDTACMCRIDAGAAIDALSGERLLMVPAAATLAPNSQLQLSGFGGSRKNYSFSSADPAIIDISSDGTIVAKSVGETTVTIQDSAGQQATSLPFRVIDGQVDQGGGDCPLGNSGVCNFMCKLFPALPWCEE